MKLAWSRDNFCRSGGQNGMAAKLVGNWCQLVLERGENLKEEGKKIQRTADRLSTKGRG